MADNQTLKTKIASLDKQRVELNKKKAKAMPWLIFFPVLGMLISFFFLELKGFAAFIPPIIAALVSGFFYGSTIGSEFAKLIAQVKEATLSAFMSNYHDSITYDYSAKRRNVKEILKRSDLISADVYEEEDVISGEMDNVKFYLSEIKLKDSDGDSTYTKFKGLLFKIKIPGKSFPNTRINSDNNFFGSLFSDLTKDDEFGLYYKTFDELKYREEIAPLLPFIKYLVEKEKFMKILFSGDEVTFILKSNMKFLDNPRWQFSIPFDSDQYYENLGKQLNSLLFIVKTFVDGEEVENLEEQLELKTIEHLKIRDEFNS